jgi:hypothetical protein
VDQLHPRHEGAQRALCQIQHRLGRIDADQGPAGIGFGQHLQFRAATRAQNQHLGIGRRAFGQQHAGHAVQIGQARHEAARAVGVPGDVFFFGPDVAALSQPGHDPPDHDGMGGHRLG